MGTRTIEKNRTILEEFSIHVGALRVLMARIEKLGYEPESVTYLDGKELENDYVETCMKAYQCLETMYPLEDMLDPDDQSLEVTSANEIIESASMPQKSSN